MKQIQSPLGMPDIFKSPAPMMGGSSGKTPISGQSAMVHSGLNDGMSGKG